MGTQEGPPLMGAQEGVPLTTNLPDSVTQCPLLYAMRPLPHAHERRHSPTCTTAAPSKHPRNDPKQDRAVPAAANLLAPTGNPPW